jgi:large subunit ribosomal protein L11
MQIKILADGGAMKPGPALSQQLGPAGINIGQVISKVNEETANFKGLSVPVILDVDMGTKDFTIEVLSPPMSGLLKKELGIEKGSAAQSKLQIANASIEQIINVANQKLPSLLCRDLKAAVKTAIGTCVSLGILIENKPASEVAHAIDCGKYAKEISEVKTEESPDKRRSLDEYFAKLHGAQEKQLSEEAAEAEAAAEAKEAAKATPAEGEATPAEGEATPEAEAPAA